METEEVRMDAKNVVMPIIKKDTCETNGKPNVFYDEFFYMGWVEWNMSCPGLLVMNTESSGLSSFNVRLTPRN